MAVSCYFGLPGVGKTTVLAAIAQKELQKIRLGKSKYSAVLTNFYCRGCERFDVKDIETKTFRRCLILIDEITLLWDSRSFKNFPDYVKEFFTLHRHLMTDIIYGTQYYGNVDKRIRDVTVNTYRVRKIGSAGHALHFTAKEKMAVKYPEDTGEIIVGYVAPTFWSILLSIRIFRGRKWYAFFDTHEMPSDGKPLYDGGKRYI